MACCVCIYIMNTNTTSASCSEKLWNLWSALLHLLGPSLKNLKAPPPNLCTEILQQKVLCNTYLLSI